MRAFFRLASLALCAAVGCSRRSTNPNDTISPAESSSAAAKVDAHPACDFTWGFHGDVGGKEAFLRLAPHGESLDGKWFDAKAGVDVPLTGKVAASHEVTLFEDPNSAPAFVGTCDATRAFSGSSRGKPFHFAPAAALDKPFVATKTLEIKAKPKTVGPFGMTDCSYKQTGFEIFGAHTIDAERAINLIGGGDGSFFDKDDYDTARACDTGFDAEYAKTIVASWRRFVNVESGGSSMADGAAHPENFVGFSRVTYDLDTGKPVTEADVFAKFPAALVDRCVKGYPPPFPDGNIGDEVDGHTFALTPKGVHVFATDYPHATAALTGHGPILSYAALLAAGALRGDSPVARAWADVPPAKTAAVECLPDDP